MKFRNVTAATAFVVLANPASVMAEGLFSNGQVTIGAGAFYSSGTYKGEKSKLGGAPFISYDSDRLHLGFDGIAYNVIAQENLTVALRAGIGDKPDYPENQLLFDGLKRGTPIEVGFDLNYDFDTFYVGGGAMVDASSEYKGYHFEAVIGTEFALGPVGVDIGAGARFRDGKLNNFLYGVGASETNFARGPYDVGNSVEPFIDVSLAYPISENVALIGMLEYQPLAKKVSDSPLVDANANYGVGLGLIYGF